MNIILLFPDDLTAPDHACLSGRRRTHVLEVHRADVGDTLRVGLLGGALGMGTVTRLDAEALELDLILDTPPPPPLPLTLVLALPRPKVLNRALIAASSLGVSRLVLLHTARVEKAYWGSPRMSDDNLLLQRVLGLEQARDTRLPELQLERRFRPFVEDRLPALAADSLRLVAHPGDHPPCPRAVPGPVTLVIGPEGGLVPFEVDLLATAGFQPVDLGPRILRVETALAALVGRLY